ncbi:hypothetical protein [Janibacter sp. GS2]|uniref:hypothetical protein n=1 Tax=Janibacter sp. GS2 TaxID=3442646 RepID=UPI003EBEDEAE
MLADTLRRATVLALSLLIAAPSVAGAADPGLDVSTDGRTWGSSLSRPLFDGGARVVPGGRTHAQVWARNSSSHRATLTVVSRDIRSTLPADVAARDDFRVRVGGTELSGGELGRCRVLASHVLDPGQRQRVPMSVGLPASSRNISQDEVLSLSLRVGIVQGTSSAPCGDGGTLDPTPAGGGDPAPPPEIPGRVQTDGGPGDWGVLPDVVGIGLLALVAAIALRGVRPALERCALRRREREQTAPRAN